MDESRIGQYSISVTTYPIMALVTHSSKIKFRAPPVRGFSYIELWMVGMQIPIVAALIEYSILLGLKKYFSKRGIT